MTTAPGEICATCGTKAPPGARFCGECGGAIVAAPPGREAAPTLFAVTSPISKPAKPPTEPPPAIEEGTATVFGVYAPAAAQAPAPPPVEDEGTATVFGVYAPRASADMPPPQASAQAPVPPAPFVDLPPEREDSLLPLVQKTEPASSGYAGSGSTGYPSYSTAHGEGRRSRRSSMAPRLSRADRLAQERKTRLLWVLGSLLVGFGLMAGGLALYRVFFGGAEVLASIESVGGAEVLVVEVPAAMAGQRVRFDGELAELSGGRTTFPLSPKDVRVGKNVVSVELVSATGQVSAHRLKLHVPFRLRPDLSRIGEDPPALGALLEAPPGSIAFLNEQPITLDAEGRGALPLPLDGDKGGASVERVVQYAIRTPEGEELRGGVTFVIPKARLVIESPGEGVTVEESSIELVLLVAPTARVTLDGAPVAHREGRATTRLPLPSLGSTVFRVRVEEEGAVATNRAIEVRRVSSIAAEIERFRADPPIAYATLAKDPDAHRGKRVKLDGLAYRVETRQGKTDVQIHARECPSGERCPIWVTYPGVLRIKPHSWIRVAGEIGGAQSFRTIGSGRVVSVPRVDAALVAPVSR